MKLVVALLFVFCYVECRKGVTIDKNANINFINMESGGVRDAPRPAQPPSIPVKAPTPAPSNNQQHVPTKAPTLTPPTTIKPVVQPITVKPIQPVQPPPYSGQITPKPVQPTPSINPITTPGPGSVKQLISCYDTQGKGSGIRPYTYSQAVKQG